MTILYKGAGPGTHWCINDAREIGFSCASNLPHSPNLVVRHIRNYSHPSPYISFTASYAIAWDYALNGPGGSASKRNPGYIYEIDILAASRLKAFDPVREIARIYRGNLPSMTDHDGDKKLILALAAPSLFGGFLLKPPKRVQGGLQAGPRVTPELIALTLALRDAEVLLQRVPAACIVAKYGVP